MPVRVVTDSTADLQPHVAKELNISIVPLSVIFGTDVFREGIDIDHDLFYDKLTRSKEMPTTSAPSPGDFIQVYEPLLEDANEIISIHLSSKLSATYQNASEAARMLAEERGARIEVIDSQSVSLGMTFLASAAARAGAGGSGLEEVKSIVERMIPQIRIIVVLDTLEYLRRGGRIGRARAFLGAMLRVKPILSLRDGEVHPEERVRTKNLAHNRMIQMVTSYERVKEVSIAYSTNPQDAEDMRRRLSEELPGIPVGIGRLGPVIGTHAGPGVLGVGVLEGDE